MSSYKIDNIDSHVSIQDTNDMTKKIKFDISNISSSTTRTLTIPDNNITIVGTNNSQTLTQKTISASSNTVGANELRTNGASVNIDSANPPILGQVLTATGSNTANWQTISGNSGSLDHIFVINPRDYKVKAKTYTIMATFIFPGSNQIGTIKNVNIISYMDSKVPSYSVRLFDTTNGVTIVENTGMTDTSQNIQTLGTVSNVPTGQSIIELQVKTDDGSNKNIYVESISIHYEN
jgi:hypothetical protein